MIVEIYGGPLDGQFQEVPDGMSELRMAVGPEVPAWFEAANPTLAPPTFTELRLPIRRRRSDGMLVAIWPHQ